MTDKELELKCINTIRTFCVDMVQAANSGHPGAPMGCAPLAHLLWSDSMSYSPSNPKWYARDRFVLSNGHACALQYCMLHLTGYGLTVEDCKKFRQVGSSTPGHPECFATTGVEVCTGPLGQGISNAVGLAMAESHLAATFADAPLGNFTFVICGDGCLQEGVSSEAGSLAGHLKLGKLIVLYDDNGITIDGSTELSFTEDVNKRYESYGWHVQTVGDVAEEGQLEALRVAVENAKAETSKPSLIKVRTVIGYGSVKEGSEKTHGAPLGAEDVASVKKKFGFDPEKNFVVDDDVKAFWADKVAKCEAKRAEWDSKFEAYAKEHPKEAEEIKRRFEGKVNFTREQLLEAMPKYNPGDKDLATRKHSEKCLNALAPLLPELIGGSADLSGSNCTNLSLSSDYQASSPAGRYIRYGVREHAMSSISNGLYAYGGMRPFCATFLTFIGYALGAMRLSALSRFGVLYIMTHDSIGLGEDGPTHQPIESLEILRSTPNMDVWRPGDGNEMVAAYVSSVERTKTPSVVCCSRSGVKNMAPMTSVEGALKGGYAGIDVENPKLILIGTGTELGLCVSVAEKLKEEHGIPTRVVSMACQEAFLRQSEEYQKSVLPGTIPTMSVEAGSINGWYQFAHSPHGMTTFGLSGKGSDVFKAFGFETDTLVKKGKDLVTFYEGKVVPDLSCRPYQVADTTNLNGH